MMMVWTDLSRTLSSKRVGGRKSERETGRDDTGEQAILKRETGLKKR